MINLIGISMKYINSNFAIKSTTPSKQKSARGIINYQN